MEETERQTGLYKYFFDVLRYPPYFAILYMGSVFMLASIVFNRFFEQSLLIFLYAIVGIFWRHIHTDIKAIYNPGGKLDSKVNKKTTLSYQIGNVILILLLIIFLWSLGKI